MVTVWLTYTVCVTPARICTSVYVPPATRISSLGSATSTARCTVAHGLAEFWQLLPVSEPVAATYSGPTARTGLGPPLTTHISAVASPKPKVDDNSSRRKRSSMGSPFVGCGSLFASRRRWEYG